MPSSRAAAVALISAAAAVAYVVLRRRRKIFVDGAEVLVCGTLEEARVALALAGFDREVAIGFDCEWTPGLKRKAEVIQLASPTYVVVMSRVCPPEALALIASESVAKVGVGVVEDARRVGAVEARNLVDLRDLAERAGYAGPKKSLAALAKVYSRASLPHKYNMDVRLGDWNKRLSRHQIEYAAGDAVASILTFYGIFQQNVDTSSVNSLFSAQPRSRSSSSTVVVKKEAKKMEGRIRWRERHLATAKNRLYDNFRLVSKDGTVLGMMSEKKATWYRETGLATRIGDGVRLTYDPDVVDSIPKGTNLRKENKCVGCGRLNLLTRFRVVPYGFRRAFPVRWKANASHDVLAVCLDCRDTLEPRYTNEIRSLLRRTKVVSFPSSDNEAMDDKKRKAAHVAKLLLEKRDLLPEDRLRILEAQVTEAFGPVDFFNVEALRRLSQQATRRKQDMLPRKVRIDRAHAAEAACVEALLKEGENCLDDVLHDLEVHWRTIFVDTLRPQFLPAAWHVAYVNLRRLRDRPHPSTLPCRVLQSGKCARGDNCKYRHDVAFSISENNNNDVVNTNY